MFSIPDLQLKTAEKEELNKTLKTQESEKQILTKNKQKASANEELLKNNEKSNITINQWFCSSSAKFLVILVEAPMMLPDDQGRKTVIPLIIKYPV